MQVQTKQNKSAGRTIGYYIAIVSVAVVYLLLCSGYTSPLFPKMLNYDSAIFMMVGQGILEGKELYTEIFDHKGPILFWIEAIGMSGGRTGVFCIQVLFMSVNIYLIDRISDIWDRNVKEKWLICILSLVILAYPLSNGNLSEEYSLPFIYLSLYCFLKDWIKNKEPKPIHSYVYGVCFGILAFIRINNGITICAIVGCWVLMLIIKREWKKLGQNLLAGAAGILTVVVPVVLYFGVRGTLYEMIYATFLFNMKYSAKMSFLANFAYKSTIAHMIILFCPLVFAAFVFAVKCRKEVMLVLEFILLANTMILFLGYGYNHYFTIAIPVITVMLCVLLGQNEGIKLPFAEIPEKLGSAAVIAGYLVLLVRIVILNVSDYYIWGGYWKNIA